MTLRRLVPEDLLRFIIPEEVQISPDGRIVYYVRQTIDEDHNRYRRQIYAIDLTSESHRPLTQGDTDTAPQPSPNGEFIAFIRCQHSYHQPYLLPLGGGEAYPLTDWASDVTHLTWLPDSRHIIAEVALKEGALPLDQKSTQQQIASATPSDKYTRDVQYITRSFYRLDTVGYLHHDQHQQLVLIDTWGKKPAEVLTPHHFSHGDAAVRPDGVMMAYQSNRHPDPDRNPYDDILVMNLETREEQCITDGHGSYHSPHFSPDGAWLYFFGHDYSHGFYSSTKLYRAALTAHKIGAPELIFTPQHGDLGQDSIDDMHAHGATSLPLIFTENGIVTLYSHRGQVGLIAINPSTHQAEPRAPFEGVIYGMCASRDQKTIAVLKADQAHPGDLFLGSIEAEPLSYKRLTALNHCLLQEIQCFIPQHFEFSSPGNGKMIDGWLLNPDGDALHPLALEVHGGPMTMYSPSFFFEFQLLVSSGIGVVFTNPHGSRGYGEAFSAAIRGAWGQDDFKDVMAGVDAALTMGRFDEHKLAILGGSYGGFMTNWAIGHSDRFSAAITMRSVVNELSFFGTSDLGYLDSWEWGTVPWEHPDQYLRHSPLMSVENIHTPLLIMHSEEDYRCPISQAEELFAALKTLDREVAFVRFPHASHELSRSGQPWYRVKRLQLIVDWMTQHLL